MNHGLSLQDVARYPRPGMSGPRSARFTPDGTRLAYLYSTAGTLVQHLWLFDLASGERRAVPLADAGPIGADDSLSLDQQLRRERGRVRELGVTNYELAARRADVDNGGDLVILVPLDGALYVRRGDDGPLRLLPGSEGALDARLSPDGSRVAFVRDDELHVADTRGNIPVRRLTNSAGNGVTNGLAEYIAQEEMGRPEGYWWSGDGARIAYVQVDSTHIPDFPIAHQGKETFVVEHHRYPFAGKPNATIRLGVLDVTVGDGATRWMDLGPDPDIYLARVAWRPDGSLTAQLQTRDQQTLRLLTFDDATGASTTLIEEQSEPWFNLSRDTRFLNSGEILWSSEQTGFRHLYLYDAQGRQIRALTEGQWVVTGVTAVDETRRVVYFTGTRDGVLDRHLYAVSLDGSPPHRITQSDGWHDVTVSPDFRFFLDRHSDLTHAPTVTLRHLSDAALHATLHEDPQATASALSLPPPELTTFHTRDGVLLHAAVYRPSDSEASDRRYPLIVAVYGGPHVQAVGNRWDLTVDMRAQYLAQQGYIVLKVDNRGSANRGLAFEGALARAMGHIEIDDQVDGVRFMAQRPYVDTQRTGIYGWSYGGYMTCLALMRAPDVFKVGVAGAPVTSWDGYDTHYTERYMGLPRCQRAGLSR